MAIFFDLPLSLGINSLNIALIYLSFFIGALTLAIGRITILLSSEWASLYQGN
jgi:Ca2+:H+ antiporter